MIDALIFDLDDTLYVERDFVASGYRAVARHIALCYRWPEEIVFDRMMGVFNTDGRGKVLEVAAHEFIGSSASVSELVDIYRRHSPSIQLAPGYEALLERLHLEFRLGILTDGMPEVQRRKIAALRLERLFDAIVYTWESGSELEKPHPFGFGLILDVLGVPPSRSVFIGDNPYKDGRGAHNAGMRFIRVLSGEDTGRSEGCHTEEKADFVVSNLYELPGILQHAGSYETD